MTSPCPKCSSPMCSYANVWRGKERGASFWYCWDCAQRWNRDSQTVALAREQLTLVGAATCSEKQE